MKLKQYVLTITESPFAMGKINAELRVAEQIIMLSGYPNGKAADECVVIYALYDNAVARLLERKGE